MSDYERTSTGADNSKRLEIKIAEVKQLRIPNQEMASSIRAVQGAVSHIQESTRQAKASSDRSMSAMENSSAVVAHSTEQINKANEQIAVFKEKAEKISEIIDMVKQIAKKSGLLALNASIEAARAGEAGRSFSVVANQIKNLSANTTASADDVVKYVEELMAEIEDLEKAMNTTTKSLEEGNKSVQDSMVTLKEVFGQISVVTTDIESINKEIRKQSSLNEDMTNSIESIAESKFR